MDFFSTELKAEIETALKYVNDPSTLEQLCLSSKRLSRHRDKVKQRLTLMVEAGTIEHYGEEYMLAVNVSEKIRDQWKKEVEKKQANFKAKQKLPSYAEVVKGNGSAPAMMDDACGSDLQKMKENRQSHGAVLSVVSNIETAVRKEQAGKQTIINYHKTVINKPTYVIGSQCNQCDFSSNDKTVCSGNIANFQAGNHNKMTIERFPKEEKRGTKEEKRERS